MVGLEEIYRRYSRDVYRYAYWISGDATEAEDLTSESFVRAWAGAIHVTDSHGTGEVHKVT